MNRKAASGLRVERSTPIADPPFSALVDMPFSVGMVATCHNPDPPGTSASSRDGIHAPENSDATCPAPSAAFHSSDHVVRLVATSPSSIIRCQNAANRATPASVSRQTVTSLPSAEVRNGRPPASQTMALKKLASPASAVMYTPISLSFLAAS